MNMETLVGPEHRGLNPEILRRAVRSLVFGFLLTLAAGANAQSSAASNPEVGMAPPLSKGVEKTGDKSVDTDLDILTKALVSARSPAAFDKAFDATGNLIKKKVEDALGVPGSENAVVSKN
jgi:hypothetical protein